MVDLPHLCPAPGKYFNWLAGEARQQLKNTSLKKDVQMSVYAEEPREACHVSRPKSSVAGSCIYLCSLWRASLAFRPDESENAGV